MKNLSYLAAILALSCFVFAGCGDTTSKDDNKATAGKKDDGHDHDHDHGDHDHDHDHDEKGDDHGALGANGGHLYAFTPDDMKLEWVHKSNNKNIFYLLNKDGKATPVKVDAFSVTSEVGEKEVFELEAADAGEDGTASKFESDEGDLARAMTLGVTVKVKTGDKEYSCKIDAHEPHSH